MSAGFSYRGRDFAAQAADLLFTSVSSLDRAPAIVQSVHDYASRHGRKIDVYTSAQIVCRKTRQEAEDFYRYFAKDKADLASLDHMRKQKQATAGSDMPSSERMENNPTLHQRAGGPIYPGTFPGAYTFVGTPDDIVGEMVQMSAAGLCGASVAFLNYTDEMPFFLDEVLPRLERAGLRGG
jgi:FMNH2-dependent dimethyl sulfone monooxygenase